jgi:hypothetical protein
MNNLLLKATRLRAQSRLYESSCLAHRIISINEQALIKAIAECETLDGLTILTDNLEKLLQNPTELLVQFSFLSSKLFAVPLISSESTVTVTNEDTNLHVEDGLIYEFMSLYDSEEVVNGDKKDATDSILDELASANAFPDEETSQAERVYEPEQYYRPPLPMIETELELTTGDDEPQDETTDLLMKGFLVSDTKIPPKRKNKSPRNGDKSQTSPGKEKKRGRPPVSPCDKKPKVKKPKAVKKVVNELSDDCDEKFDK